ncbi:MAG: hypothetical protein U0869_04670 [Chloroflexota bacterium]
MFELHGRRARTAAARCFVPGAAPRPVPSPQPRRVARDERAAQAVAHEVHGHHDERWKDHARRQPHPRLFWSTAGARAAEIISPRLASAAGRPCPNERAASSRIALATPKVATTVSGPKML